MKVNNIDKRKYARLDIRTKINVSAIDSAVKNPHSERLRAVGKNIGVNGILFTTDKKLAPGTIVTLEIFLPDKDAPIYVEGEVRWSTPVKSASNKNDKKNKYDVGINFLTIDKNHILMLLNYVCGDLGGKS